MRRAWCGGLLQATMVYAVLAGAEQYADAQGLPSATPGGIYACTDARGRRLTADRPIAECVDRDQRVLGTTGVELRRVGPTLTENERQELEAQRRKQQLEQQRQREERYRERALVARYPNVAAHDAERSHALSLIDELVAVAEQRRTQLQAQRQKMDTEMEFYQKNPSKAPASLRRQVAENDSGQQEQLRYIELQDQERRRIHQRFDAELEQLRALWAVAAAAGQRDSAR